MAAPTTFGAMQAEAAKCASARSPHARGLKVISWTVAIIETGHATSQLIMLTDRRAYASYCSSTHAEPGTSACRL